MQKSNRLYTIVVSDNGQISVIPKPWIICSGDFPIIGEKISVVLPTIIFFKKHGTTI